MSCVSTDFFKRYKVGSVIDKTHAFIKTDVTVVIAWLKREWWQLLHHFNHSLSTVKYIKVHPTKAMKITHLFSLWICHYTVFDLRERVCFQMLNTKKSSLETYFLGNQKKKCIMELPRVSLMAGNLVARLVLMAGQTLRKRKLVKWSTSSLYYDKFAKCFFCESWRHSRHILHLDTFFLANKYSTTVEWAQTSCNFMSFCGTYVI